MKVFQEHHEPETVKDREPYRISVEGKDGTRIDITEQADGGFHIGTSHFTTMVIQPRAHNAIMIKAVK